MKSRFSKITLAAVAASMMVGCAKSADSYSLLADASSYKQNAQYIPRKVDILWVVDNSGSMASSQNNLANNFRSFIAKFHSTGSNFRMAVTTSDAWYAPYTSNRNNHARLKPGKDLSNKLHYVMTPDTPDLENVFLTAIKQGTGGSGDERAFSSFEEALSNPLNSDFRRPEAFLAVINVSDEDDFSHSDDSFSENYNNPLMYSIQHYVDYLTNLTAIGGTGKNFSVNTISVLDQTCLNSIYNGAQKIGQRYIQLANATGGQKISLCSDFSQSLQVLSESIVELSSVFNLNRAPVPESITVSVNGVSVRQDANNGWTYDAAAVAIAFHGSAIPAAGADVVINFDPAGVKN